MLHTRKGNKACNVSILECQLFPSAFCWMGWIRFAVGGYRLTLKARAAGLGQAAPLGLLCSARQNHHTLSARALALLSPEGTPQAISRTGPAIFTSALLTMRNTICGAGHYCPNLNVDPAVATVRMLRDRAAVPGQVTCPRISIYTPGTTTANCWSQLK